jgi:hypothetical protein
VRAENAKGTDALVEARESVGRVLRVAISSCVRESVDALRIVINDCVWNFECNKLPLWNRTCEFVTILWTFRGEGGRLERSSVIKEWEEWQCKLWVCHSWRKEKHSTAVPFVTTAPALQNSTQSSLLGRPPLGGLAYFPKKKKRKVRLMRSPCCLSVRLSVSPTNNFWTKRYIFREIYQGSHGIKGNLDAIFLIP